MESTQNIQKVNPPISVDAIHQVCLIHTPDTDVSCEALVGIPGIVVLGSVRRFLRNRERQSPVVFPHFKIQPSHWERVSEFRGRTWVENAGTANRMSHTVR